MSQHVMYQSLKRFLERKGFVNAADAQLEGWPLVLDNAYKSYALNRLGLNPQLIPMSLEQVDPRILDDDDWLYLEDGLVNTVEGTEDGDNGKEAPKADTESDTPAGITTEPAVPPQTAAPVQPPVPPVDTPKAETEELSFKVASTDVASGTEDGGTKDEVGTEVAGEQEDNAGESADTAEDTNKSDKE